MLLSICIPTFNRKSQVESLILHLKKQIIKYNLYRDCEIVVCENSDKEKQLVDSNFKKKHKRNVRFLKPNIPGSFQSNLNNLINSSKGKFTWFLGDDDYIFDNALDVIINSIKKNKIDSSYITFRCSGKPGLQRSKNNDIYFSKLPKSKHSNKKDYKNLITMNGDIFLKDYWLSVIFLSLCIFKTKEFRSFIKKKSVKKYSSPGYHHASYLIPFINTKSVTVLLDILIEDSYNFKFYEPEGQFKAWITSWINFTFYLDKIFKINDSVIFEMRKISILQIISMYKYSLLFHLSFKKSKVIENIYMSYFQKSKIKFYPEYLLLKLSYYSIRLINFSKIISLLITRVAKIIDKDYFSRRNILKFKRNFSLIKSKKATISDYAKKWTTNKNYSNNFF